MDKWNQVGDSLNAHGIEATAFRSENAKIGHHYELGLFFGTFEERGLTSSLMLKEKSCSHSIIVFFDEERSEELRIRYDPILIEQVNKCSEEKASIIYNISIKNIEENLELILKKVPSDCWQLDSHWFVDIAGAPIPYFVGLLGYLRDMFPRPKLTLFNPTGDYGEKKSGYSFTSGFDRNIWIPRLWGRPDPTLKWTYIFLLGFEGSRSNDVYYLCEPQNTLALLGELPTASPIATLRILKVVRLRELN